MPKKINWKPIVLIGAVLLLICCGVYYNNYKQYTLNLANAEEAFKEYNYSSALKSYNLAYDYKNNKSIQNKIKLCKRLETSVKHYNSGSKLQKLGENYGYKEAYKEFKKVIHEDTQYYKKAQVNISSLKPKLADEAIKEAAIAYQNKSYVQALTIIREAVEIDSSNKKLLELNQFYNEANKSWQQAIVAKWDAERKSQQLTEQQKYAPQKIVDSNGKQIWKIYIDDGDFHFSGTYKGSGNFIVKISDSNQDLIAVIANEIGDFVSDKTVSVPYDGWYYLQITGTYGSWNSSWR